MRGRKSGMCKCRVGEIGQNAGFGHRKPWTALLMSGHVEMRPWTRNQTNKALCLRICVCICTSVPACLFIGGKGTSWATWNPRGNRDRSSGAQGKVCHPIVLEN